MVEYQLRRFRIAQARMDEFLEGWTRGVLPLRKENGFETIGAWVVADTDEFVWVLRYEGPKGFEAADRAYYKSAARKTLDPDPAQYIESVEQVFVDPVL